MLSRWEKGVECQDANGNMELERVSCGWMWCWEFCFCVGFVVGNADCCNWESYNIEVMDVLFISKKYCGSGGLV